MARGNKDMKFGQRNSVFVVATLAVTAVGLMACGAKNQDPQSSRALWMAGTPVAAHAVKTGTVVALSDEQRSQGAWSADSAIQFASAHGGSVRIVSEESGVYEFFDVEEETLEQAFKSGAGGAEVFANRYIERMINTRDHAEILAARAMEQICPKGRDFGMPVMVSLKDEASMFRRRVMKLGGTVELRIEDPMKRSTSQLFVVIGPKHSAMESEEFKGATLKLTPDVPGGYFVVGVGVSAEGKCGVAAYEFGVTVDGAYLGKSRARAFQSSDRDKFKHLAVINAEKAWASSKRGRGVRIAVVDTGVNYNHPDLRANIATDAQGKILGRDFCNEDDFPMDDNSHGTHVAGLAASAVTGVAPAATVIPLKALDALGGGDMAGLTAAIRFAADNGAHIINASFGGEGANEQMAKAIDYARKKGVVFMAAAGNGDMRGVGFDIDTRKLFPASYTFSNVITVAATNLTGSLSVFSNFGLKTVSVAAPGGDRAEGGLAATNYLPEKASYVDLMGTSMATPVMSGVAALVLSQNPSLKPQAVKLLLESAGKKVSALEGRVRSGRLVDAQEAVRLASRVR